MRSLVGLLFVCFLRVSLIPDTAWGQTPPKPTFAMQIQVQARLQDGSPAPRGSSCKLEVQNGQMLEQAQTDSSGKCRFVPSAHGIYLIRIKAPGYLEATEKVDLQNSQTGMAFLVLQPEPKQAPAEPPGGAKATTISAIDLSVPEPARKELELAQQSLQKHDLDAGHTWQEVKFGVQFDP
jgi:hypothetical protein